MCKNYEFSAFVLEEAGWNGVIDHSGPHEGDVVGVRNRNGDWESVLGYSLNNLDDVGEATDLDKTEDTEEEHGMTAQEAGRLDKKWKQKRQTVQRVKVLQKMVRDRGLLVRVGKSSSCVVVAKTVGCMNFRL
jgi:hypothetical protein